MDGRSQLLLVINSDTNQVEGGNEMSTGPINEHPETFLTKIESAIGEGNYIFSLFLEHSALESYLSDLILITNGPPIRVPNTTIEAFKRINFEHTMSLNNLLGNIDNDLYGRIKGFNKERNKFVHGLIGVDFTDSEISKKVKKLSSEGLSLCKIVSKIYEDRITEIAMGMDDPSDEFRGT